MPDFKSFLFRGLLYTPMRDVLRGRMSGRLDWRRPIRGASLPADRAAWAEQVVRRAGVPPLLRIDAAAISARRAMDSASADVQSTADRVRLDLQPERSSLWGQRLAACGLPGPVVDLVTQLTTRTGLWMSEKSAVAAELTAHFSDGLAAGRTPGDLIESFGDVTTAARLISTAKKRQRSSTWQGLSWFARVMCLAVVFYGLSAVRFFAGQPSPTIPSPSRSAAPTVAEADRAWPLWQKAIDRTTVRWSSGQTVIGPEIMGDPVAYGDWLRRHADEMATARAAAARPDLGLSGGLNDDDLQSAAGRLIELSWLIARDARSADEEGDADRCRRDMMALLDAVRQTRGPGTPPQFRSAGVSIMLETIWRVRAVLSRHPEHLTDGLLMALAHGLGAPKSASDFDDPDRDVERFAARLGQWFTDDGDGDGRITPDGVRQLAEANASPSIAATVSAYRLASIVPGVTASRRELLDEARRLATLARRNYAVSYHQADWADYESERRRLGGSTAAEVRWFPLRSFWYGSRPENWYVEMMLAHRDALEISLALETYRRRHGAYPASTADLRELLPEVPPDRIAGGPLVYRLVDGKPLLYSVGLDGVDDGGRSTRDLNSAAVSWMFTTHPSQDIVFFPPADER